MNNEPVAHITETYQGYDTIEYTNKDTWFELPVGTPLYLHPKDLTDLEILDLLGEHNCDDDESKFEFARAILRKAQGK